MGEITTFEWFNEWMEERDRKKKKGERVKDALRTIAKATTTSGITTSVIGGGISLAGGEPAVGVLSLLIGVSLMAIGFKLRYILRYE